MNLAMIRTTAFMLSGLTAGIAGIIYASRLRSVSTSLDGGTLVLYSVAAAVIGGTSLFGGRGKALHAVLGGIVIASIYNGMGLLGMSAASQYMITALVLLAAVTVDALARRGRTASGRIEPVLTLQRTERLRVMGRRLRRDPRTLRGRVAHLQTHDEAVIRRPSTVAQAGHFPTQLLMRRHRAADLGEEDPFDIPAADCREIAVDAQVAEDAPAVRRAVDHQDGRPPGKTRRAEAPGSRRRTHRPACGRLARPAMRASEPRGRTSE